MAAPRRNTNTIPLPNPELTPNVGTSLLQHAPLPSPPMRVRAPGSAIDDSERSLIRFSQIIMLAIALGAIWFSIYNIAFSDEGTSNADFAVLFFGGILSAGFAIGWIEAQSRSNGHQLRDVQDYMLGIGFFFATVGTVWGARFVLGLFEGSTAFGSLSNEDGWYPNGNGIYVQTAAILLLMVAQYKLLQRYKGQTKFGWAVASYAPMIVLLGAGMNIWLKWSGNVVSYEIGISLIVLSIAAMEMALRSNNSINLTVIVIASSIAPILFESAHDVDAAKQGGALSLLVFIIAIQGYYASKKELRTDIIQRASLVLIGIIVLAMLFARGDNLSLILGPLTADALGGLSQYFTLIVALWLAVLGFYFPAMLDQRLPWIPIGLAFALMIIPTDESTIPWLVTVAILPYMLLISTATRQWVANGTMAMAAISYIVVDLVARAQEIAQIDTYGTVGLHLLIPIAFVAVSELAQRRGKIDIQIHMLVIGCVALSRAVLFAEEWYMPWFFIVYLLYLARTGLDEIGDDAPLESRWRATLGVLLANSVMIALVALGRLNVPDQLVFGGYSFHVFAAGAISYFLLLSGRNKEFDLGMTFAWFGSSASGAPTYDPETQTWKENKLDEGAMSEWCTTHSWSPLARSSLIIPFIMMTAGIFIANGIESDAQIRNFVSEPVGVLLLALPISCLVWEILDLKTITSRARATAVWILFGMGLGPSLFINVLREEMPRLEGYASKYILPAAILLDFILLAAPLVVAWAIERRGLDKTGISPPADLAAMIGLIAIACLDTSGGWLMIPMLTLVTYQSVRYGHSLALILAPLALVLTNNMWLDLQGFGWKLSEAFPSWGLDERSMFYTLGLSRLSGVLVVLQMSYILMAQFSKKENKHQKALPWLGAWVWMAIGLMACFPGMDWFLWMPLFFTAALMLNAWFNGQVQYLPALGFAQFVSLIIAIGGQPWTLSELDVISWAALLSGATALGFAASHESGILYKNLDETTKPDDATSAFTYPETIEQRQELNEQFQLVGYIGLTLSVSVLWGIGTMVGALMLTKQGAAKGQYNILLLAPLVHGLAFYNFLMQAELLNSDLNLSLIGGLLIAEGFALGYGSIKNDAIYDYDGFDWPSDNAFFEFTDRMGIIGVGTIIAGIFFLINNPDWDTLTYGLTTVVLIGVGIQGYSDDYDARWRRVFGGYGSIFTAFITAFTLDGLMQNVSIMGAAIVAMGWLFMNSSRLGDTNELYIPDPNAVQPVMASEQPAQPAPQLGSHSVPAAVPEPERAVEMVVEVEPVIAKSKGKTEPKMENLPLQIPEPVLSVKERVKTRHGFEIELPDDMFKTILSSIDMTPHEGYKPVVSFGPRGEIVLEFEAI